ncbi:MAG: lipopolysaccharide heptosyltransferase I [Methylophilaceae bacterium]|nr:lipopolysaccharide heptosyltransferase I [Methylophilaceae bacterium]
MLRILLVKTSSMGDVIHNMAVVSDIHAHFPDALIDWVVETSFNEIIKLNPNINTIIPVAVRRWKRAIFNCQTWREIATFKRQINVQKYDAILDTQALLKSAIISRLANGITHGPNTKTAREPLAGFLYHRGYDIPPKIHALTRYRMLAAQALGYTLPSTPPVYNLQVDGIHSTGVIQAKIPQNYVMALHSTARDAKLWPVGHWVALGHYLASKGLSILLPWGSEAELARSNLIAAPLSNAVVLPKMNLTQLAVLITKAQAAIGVDTGLMHIAVAFKIPTLAIFCDTYIWQAGAMPSNGAIAITIGGKRACPSVNEAIQAFSQIIPT